MLFNEEVKILLAESFIKAEFLVPFPVYNLTLSPAIFNLIQKLSEPGTQQVFFANWISIPILIRMIPALASIG